jgi:hypothetical protein
MGLIKGTFIGFWFVRIWEVVVGYISTSMAVKKLSLSEAKNQSNLVLRDLPSTNELKNSPCEKLTARY